MPKLEKPKGKAVASARSSASAGLSKSASSKKKKKTTAGAAHHAASLGDDLDKLANPGKLKPIAAKADAKAKAARKAGGKEELKLDNQLLVATKLGSKSKKSSELYGTGEMEDEAEAEEQPDFGEDDDEEDEDEAEAAPIPARMSKKILDSVHRQQQEEMGGEGMEEEAAGGAGSSARRLKNHLVNLSAQDAADLDDNFDDDGEDYGVNEGDAGSGGDDDDDAELSLEDQQSLELFMPKSNTLKAKSMADGILARIAEKEAEAAASGAGSGFAPSSMSHGSNVKFGPGFGAGPSSSLAATFGLPTGDAAGDMVRSKLNPKVAEVYTKVGKFLSHYTSGKVPKAFKVIPNLRSWEEVLFLTAPDSWSAQAHLVATRIFASNFNPKMAQRFFSLVLLPKVRSDIERNKSLNFHLYQAIKKSLYKPAAFFKGILLPLAEEGATAREAIILSSILAKCTIPVLHSSVALLKLAQMPFSGTGCLFLKTLLNKKYSLPVKVVAALVQFFCRFQTGGASLGAMPLIWHQTLLAFVQRYKFELSSNQIQALKNLVKIQNHPGVTPEIRREMMAITTAQQQGLVPAVGQFQFVAMPNGAPKPSGFPQAAAPAFTSLAASLQNPQSFSMGN